MPAVRVKVCFGQGLQAVQELQVELEASNTLKEAKERIAAAAGGSVRWAVGSRWSQLLLPCLSMMTVREMPLASTAPGHRG